jgi:N-acetylglucosaminyl-diphospho-decaprenol L-rhamnosyltransferase
MCRGDVSVVIVNWHDWDRTVQAIASVRASEDCGDAPVVVVDNEHRADVPALAVEGVHVLTDPQNLGYAGGNNAGIRFALAADPRPRFILIMNNDCQLDPAALKVLVAYGREHPAAGIVGPVILNADGSHQTSGARFVGGSVRQYANPPTAPRSADFASGACMLVRADVFDTVGVLDERFFHYGEDVDFCLRVKRAGQQIVIVPDATVRHRRFNSLGPRTRQLTYYSVRNSFLFAQKHGWTRVAWWHVLRHLVPVRTLLKGDWKQVSAAWRGVVDGMRGVEGRQDVQ